MERLHYIYKITNLINNKIYIGQTVNPQDRWRDHKRDARRNAPSMIIHQAIKKHGADNFSFEVIEICASQPEANYQEEWNIKIYCSHVETDNGYNVSFGGSNAPKTEEWKKAQSELRKGKHYCPETQFKKGHKLSEETRSKMSERRKGSIPANKKTYTPEELTEIVVDYQSGISIRKIAVRLGVNKTTATRILIEQNCEIRKCTEQRWLHKKNN